MLSLPSVGTCGEWAGVGRGEWVHRRTSTPLWIIEIQLVLFILTTDNCTKLPKAETCFTSATLDGAALSASVSCSKSCIDTLQRFGCFRWWWWWLKKHWHIWCIWFLSSPDGSPSIGVFVWYLDRNYHRNPATGYQYAVFSPDKRGPPGPLDQRERPKHS